jgi:hypothetical protein
MDSDSQPYDLPRDTLFSFDELAELFELYTRIYPSEKKLTQLETCLEYLGLNQYANQFAIRHNLQAKADHKIVPPLTAKHMPRMEKTSSYSTNKSKPKHPIAGDDIWILYVWYVIKFGGPAAIVVLLVWQIITYQLSRF